MPRREYTRRVRCPEPGCREYACYRYGTQREYAEHSRDLEAHPFKCNRHAKPDENLRPGNTATEQVRVATRVRSDLPAGRGHPEWLDGLYWLAEDGGHGSGFSYGPGFTAYASDFPEGTRLIVSARVEIPETATEEADR